MIQEVLTLHFSGGGGTYFGPPLVNPTQTSKGKRGPRGSEFGMWALATNIRKKFNPTVFWVGGSLTSDTLNFC